MKTKLLPKLLWFTVLTLVGSTIAPPTEHSANTAVAPDKAAIKEWLTMFEYDSNQPLDIREIKTEQREGINIHDLTYASPVSGTVSAYLVTPDGPGPYAIDKTDKILNRVGFALFTRFSESPEIHRIGTIIAAQKTHRFLPESPGTQPAVQEDNRPAPPVNFVMNDPLISSNG